MAVNPELSVHIHEGATRSHRRPWIPPRLTELGRFTELTRLQVSEGAAITGECNVTEPNCNFFGGSAPAGVPPGAIDLRGF